MHIRAQFCQSFLGMEGGGGGGGGIPPHLDSGRQAHLLCAPTCSVHRDSFAPKFNILGAKSGPVWK